MAFPGIPKFLTTREMKVLSRGPINGRLSLVVYRLSVNGDGKRGLDRYQGVVIL